mmetsp:Transcript_1569/g.2550  ORF Transcript_1569/g.2550 Transcript_1569/m.2550 type:complete len:213 (-) Transcript_1569:61-699(-)
MHGEGGRMLTVCCGMTETGRERVYRCNWAIRTDMRVRCLTGSWMGGVTTLLLTGTSTWASGGEAKRRAREPFLGPMVTCTMANGSMAKCPGAAALCWRRSSRMTASGATASVTVRATAGTTTGTNLWASTATVNGKGLANCPAATAMSTRAHGMAPVLTLTAPASMPTEASTMALGKPRSVKARGLITITTAGSMKASGLPTVVLGTADCGI